jgi:outer membrane protein assembly factor BamB
VVGHDPETGAVLWQADWGVRAPTTANPLQIGTDSLLVSSGYGVGCGLLEINRDETGWQPEWVYHSPRLKAKFANYVPFGDYVYGLDDGVLTCIDPETGQPTWKRGRYGHGQLLLVGDALLVQSEQGDLHLIEASPEGLREQGEVAILESKAWNTMAISGNLLLMRNHKDAVCLELPTR